MPDPKRLPALVTNTYSKPFVAMNTVVIALALAALFLTFTMQLSPCGGTVQAAQCTAGDDKTITGDLTLEGGVSFIVSKPATETVANNSLQDDDDFTFEVEANKVYAFTGFWWIDAAATPDFQFDWVVPSGTTVDGLISDALPTFDVFDESAATVLDGTGVPKGHMIHGFIDTGANGGTAKIQWAQNTTDANGTDLIAGSWLLLQEGG